MTFFYHPVDHGYWPEVHSIPRPAGIREGKVIWETPTCSFPEHIAEEATFEDRKQLIVR